MDVRSLCRTMRVETRTYREAAERSGVSEAELCARYDPDGFVTWSKRASGYVIYYNQNMNEQQLRWTLMHELSHVHLGHVQALRTREKGKLHAWMETEADGMTRRVLCPSIVLHDLQALQPERIARCCGVSRQAARFASERMAVFERRNCYRMDALERQVEQQFMDFIRRGRPETGLDSITLHY